MPARASEVTQQAARWVVQLRSPDRPTNCESEFAGWLRASPVHVREYLAAVEVWEGMGHPALELDVRTEQLAAASGPPDNLVELPTPKRTAGQPRIPLMRRAAFRVMSLAAVLLLAVLGVLGWKHLSALEVATGVGEQRSSVLPDHSIVELNTRSEVRVVFTSTERRIELVRGEAFFEVAKDPGRPFIVTTDVATARAIGTRFNVHRTVGGTIVTVAEGRVVVHDTLSLDTVTAGSGDSVEVRPTAQTETHSGQKVRMYHTDLERSLAWRERRLVFDGELLGKVVEEFNRYNAPPMVIVDPSLSGERISGVFGANDPESLLEFLEKVDHIPVQRVPGHVILIGSAPAADSGK